MKPKIGDKMICVDAGKTLLVNGFEYTVIDCMEELVEMKQCPGFLFSPHRFRPSAQGKEPQS